jgi:DNA-binding GntR family transcriptional regulator
MIYRELKSAIMSGIYPEGRQLTVKEIVERTTTSAMPVREAIRRLVAENGLETRPNGTVAVPQRSMRERAIVHASRIHHETLAVCLAARAATTADIQDLRRINGEYEEAIEIKDWALALYALSGSGILLSLIESLWLANGPYVANYVHTLIEGSWGDERAKHHRAILDALARGNGDAAGAALRADISAIEELEKELEELLAGSELAASLAIRR